MPAKIFYKIILIFITCLFSCARDHEDIQAFKGYLSSVEHVSHLHDIAGCIECSKFGYDNIVDQQLTDSLKQATQAYVRYLANYKPEYNSTRKLQQDFIDIAQIYHAEFQHLIERIDVYRVICARIDSLEAVSKESELVELRNQKGDIRDTITNKFLIKRSQIFISDITEQFNKFRRWD